MNAARPNSNALWIIDFADPVMRFEMEGQAIKSGEPILIRHVNTNVYLASDQRFKIKNDFGSENEVHCHNHSSNNKSQNLALEQDGRLTVDVPTKFQQANNVFTFCTAPDASYAREIAELSKFDIDEIMKDLTGKIYDRSCFGVRALTAIFQAMDTMGDHKLEADDFRWGLMDFGIQVSKEDASELQTHFDNSGCINWSHFLNRIKVSIYLVFIFLTVFFNFFRVAKTGQMLERDASRKHSHHLKQRVP